MTGGVRPLRTDLCVRKTKVDDGTDQAAPNPPAVGCHGRRSLTGPFFEVPPMRVDLSWGWLSYRGIVLSRDGIQLDCQILLLGGKGSGLSTNGPLQREVRIVPHGVV